MKINRRGFILAEVLVYIFTAIVVLTAIVYFSIQLYRLYTELVLPARVDRVGSALMHELAKELRSGVSVDQGATAFGVPTGFITIDARTGDTTMIKYFGLESGRVAYRENGGAITYRTPADLTVSTFRFTPVVTPVSYAVRYELSITYFLRGEEHLRSYTGLAIMRHSYE